MGSAPRMRWPAAYFLAICGDGSKLACARRYDVVLVDLRSRKILYRCRPIPHPWCVAFSPDSCRLAVASAHGVTALLDTSSGIPVGFTTAERDQGCSTAFTSDGRLLEGKWNGDLILTSENGEIVGRELHPGEMISRISHDATRRLWLIQHTRKPVRPDESPKDYLTLRIWPEWNRSVRTFDLGGHVESATLSPDGQFVAYLERWENQVCVLRISDGKVLATGGPIRTGGSGFELAWSLDCRYLGIVTKTGFSIVDAKDLTVKGTVSCKFPSALGFHPDHKNVVFGTWERSALLSFDALLGNDTPI